MKSKRIGLYILSTIFPTMILLSENPTKVIAHRGYWDCPGSAQNSIFALKKAAEISAYGSEFDVSITLDGIPVVNHDDRINGLLIEKTPYRKLQNIKIANGETLPTLKQYLEEGKKEKDLQLILEIKPHSTQEKEQEAVKIITSLVDSLNMANHVEYISFSEFIIKELVRITKNANISYLEGDLAPKAAKEIGCTGLDYRYSVLQKHPEWIGQAKELGLTINTWTVDDPKTMQWMIDKKVDFITTDNPLMLQKRIKENTDKYK
ncbi:MAG: glycerophosphodiester phosphodiesterase family protein [Bacteroidales bacterium]|nr:glycerophosphodiester phosphodiesterase family protein [Bacteroidales bacterium]